MRLLQSNRRGDGGRRAVRGALHVGPETRQPELVLELPRLKLLVNQLSLGHLELVLLVRQRPVVRPPHIGPTLTLLLELQLRLLQALRGRLRARTCGTAIK